MRASAAIAALIRFQYYQHRSSNALPNVEAKYDNGQAIQILTESDCWLSMFTADKMNLYYIR